MSKFGTYLAYLILGTFIFIGLFGSKLASNEKIFCFRSSSNVHSECKFYLNALVQFEPTFIDLSQSNRPPMTRSQDGRIHYIGTDILGRDVAAIMIRGTSVALKIGFLSMFFSFVFGVPLGMLCAYYGNNRLQAHLGQLVGYAITFSIFAYLFYYYGKLEKEWILILLFLLSLWIVKFLFRFGMLINIPLDHILMRIIEIRKSIPTLFFLLILSTIIVKPSILSIVFVISFLSFLEFARYARAETLGVKENLYITSAQIVGLDTFQILYRHILPNILPTLLVLACFGISGALLLESTLSFLGIGIPLEEVTWGKLIAEGRNLNSWWLVTFPGIALFALVFSLNQIASNYKAFFSKKWGL